MPCMGVLCGFDSRNGIFPDMWEENNIIGGFIMRIKYQHTLYNKNNPYGTEKTVVANGTPCNKPSYLIGCDTGYIFIKTKTQKIHIIEITKIKEIDGKPFFACCLNCGRCFFEYGYDLCKKHDETMENPEKEKCKDYLFCFNY